MKKPAVLVADDHGIVLEGLVRILSGDFDVVGTARDGYGLLEEVFRLRPHVIISDLNMPGLNGIDVLRRIRAAKLRTKFILLTVSDESETASVACAEGASGYILKHSAASELTKAVRAALAGDVYVDPVLAPEGSLNFVCPHRESHKRTSALTQRELEVLRLVAEGRMLKEIAAILKISQSTAGFHKYNVMGKLKLRTTAQLTQYAIRHGLVTL